VTINRIENRRHEPRFTTIRKLAAALGVPPDQLTGSDQLKRAA
jgi:transcriptional regulator with XRE-family HTH domain